MTQRQSRRVACPRGADPAIGAEGIPRRRAPRPLWGLTLLCLAGCTPPLGAPPVGALPLAEPPSLPSFREVAREAGIRFVHDHGGYGRKLFPEIMGSGAAFFDANGDGWLDIFLVNGSALPGHPAPRSRPSHLYLNRGDGTFKDATDGCGLDRVGYGMGVAVGDVDNDGDEDLYVTRVGRNSLYLNRGDGTFRERTREAPIPPDGFSTSAAFLDYDGDGLLDLYVCRYVRWRGIQDDFQCLNRKGQKRYCDVHTYEPVEHRLYHNRGGARFEDVTARAGMAGRPGRGLAVVSGDYDQDGDPDLFVANDETPNFLWRNEGRGRFLEAAAVAGFAYNAQNVPTAGMGLDLADADGDGLADVIESDFQDQRKTLYVNEGQGFFTPNKDQRGPGDLTLDRLGFGIGFLDFDLDGWPDLFIANGHVLDDVEEFQPHVSYQQAAQLLHNTGGGRFVDRSSQLGAYGQRRRVGRGAAFGDFDNDGDPDILVTNNHQEPALLRNDGPRRHHWLGIRCVGRRANRSGYGVRITLEAGGRTQVDETRAASSYLCSSDPRLLFGLGPHARVDRLKVVWPGGKTQEFRDVGADRYVTVREGDPQLH